MTQAKRKPASDKSAGPDGIVRPESHHAELDEMAAALFGRGNGKRFLQYLKNISVEVAHAPDVSDSVLRHYNGMRYLYGIIEARTNAGLKRREKSK